MNKKQQRELENKIREAMEEPADLTEDEIADIRNRAYFAYQKKMEDEKQPSKNRKKKSGLLRRTVAVFAIAIGLIVVSVVYSVLAPVTIGNANSFVRRAAIWVNDQLHLGISFPVPEEEAIVIDSLSNSFSSIEDASRSLSMPIIYIKEMKDIEFCGIEQVASDDDSSILFLHYKFNGNSIDLTTEKIGLSSIIDIVAEESFSVSSALGRIIVWKTGDTYRATLSYNEFIIEIYGFVSREDFIRCCQSLDVFN